MDNRWRLKPRPSRVQEKLRQRRAVEDEYLNLLERYECLREEVEPRFRPDELQPVIDDRAQLAEMAILKIKMAEKNKEIAALDREVTIEELKIWPHSREFLERRMRLVSGRFLAAGEEVWTSERKRIGELHSNFFPICNLDFHDCMVALYRQPDAPGGEAMFGTSTTGETMVVPSDGWRADSDGGPMVRCQISGELFPVADMRVVPIVPDFVDSRAFGPLLFGGGAESLRGSGNFLSLHREIEKWFGTYKLVILPNDPEETPIRRWKTAVISSQLNSERFAGRETLVSAFDSQELVFNGEERPVAEFAYFHFVMALVRAKMLNYEGWRDVWAEYWISPPFPRGSLYMRECMLFALFTHFSFCGADLVIIDSWIRGNGFYEDEILRGREKDELARRILVGVEEAVVKTEDRAERIAPSDDSETESDGSEDSEDDSEADSSEGNSESDGSEDDSESDGSEDDLESDSSEEDLEADSSDDLETDNSEHGSETDNPEGGSETDDSEDHSGTESDSAEDYMMED
ncbi:unnamed protein product [Clonostachys rosea f. rosea IK726]|uniref:Uncharacterized protein n=1 Tax=Clonostachys rosea f. rosea IK726 TaxID=1349383 RepID=A0ACA9UAW2_BIOOC|nr:unnamed protein product [Clonostachys rosea f. rosea IK726]